MTTEICYSIKANFARNFISVDSITTMTANVTTAFWSMTINNPDDRDYALVRNGYPDYCREIIHTPEEGKEGTPHIQAYIKLQRQQRLSFLKKLFPGGHFKPLTNAEYVHNTKMYSQKDDDTTRGAHVHTFHDPTGTVESLVKTVMLRIYRDLSCEDYSNKLLFEYRKMVEKRMVVEDYKNAKVFVSATYRAMWKDFGPDMYSCIVAQHTHTHTHSDEKFSRGGSINEDADEDSSNEGTQVVEVPVWEGEDSEGDEDSEGSGSETGSEGDDSGCSESDAESQD